MLGEGSLLAQQVRQIGVLELWDSQFLGMKQALKGLNIKQAGALGNDIYCLYSVPAPKPFINLLSPLSI